MIERFATNPLIYPGLCSSIGNNINGPSVIRVPDWIEDPLGIYYMYFAHHDGQYIRLAYSDALEGPWRVHQPGVLALQDSFFLGHIASPDVHVDHEAQQIRLYFHGADAPTQCYEPQYTRLALSSDGLHFAARSDVLGNPYMRVFRFDDWWYGLAMPGVFYRSETGLNDFARGPTLFTEAMRHCAVCRVEKHLQVIYTNVGDAPESLLISNIDITDDWMQWRSEEPHLLLQPELPYEGAALACRPSVRGMATAACNELRDPCLFDAGDVVTGNTADKGIFLFYAIAGEAGIAGARLIG